MKFSVLSLLWVAVFMFVPTDVDSKETVPERLNRKVRHIVGFLTSTSNLDELHYPFCKIGNEIAACLEDVICAAERGRFLGYCGYADGVCCSVIKTCDAKTSSHAVRFQNPKFPKNESESRSCRLSINIGRGICAVRIFSHHQKLQQKWSQETSTGYSPIIRNFNKNGVRRQVQDILPSSETSTKMESGDKYRMTHDVMELSKYSSDYCPVDSLSILGTKKIAAPICGNMSGWETTFEVNELSTITLAYALQGNPTYRFSTHLTQLPCRDIIPLKSSINAGIKNLDAEEYVPSPSLAEDSASQATTTEMPSTTDATDTTGEPIDTTIPVGGDEGPVDDEPGDKVTTTTFVPPRRTAENSTTPLPITSTATTTIVPSETPLPTATIRTTTEAVGVIVESTEDDHIILGSYDPSPESSIFRRIFEARIKDKCYVYEDAEVFNEFSTSDTDIKYYKNEIWAEGVAGERCWLYDAASDTYKASQDCGNEDEEEQGFRVIGGKLTNLNEYPWQAALIYKKRFFCGAALVSDRYVVTASHCLFGSFGGGIQDLQVSLGDHDLRTKNETDNKLLGVRRVIWNLHYITDETKNDIGLLELSEPVEFSYSISAVNLPTDLENTYEGQNVTVTGWGRNNLRSKKTSPILKEYTAAVDSIETCVKRWDAYPKISAIKDMHICLNVTYGTPCHGDSGGPLVSCTGARCTLIGVVSFGFPLCRNVGLPAVFTRVTSYKRWIDINTSPLHYHNL